jgi:single-stranded-DNA-specific exonuclease
MDEIAPRPLLDVTRSLTGRTWRLRPVPERAAEAIAQRHELPDLVARMLAARGVGGDEVANFLNPTLRAFMPAPSRIADMEKAARRLARAVEGGEAIGIIGDYDVDGMTSSAIMVRFLRAAGAVPRVHLPDRLAEGYGPSRRAVEALAGEGVRLLLTLDCGVTAHDPLEAAASLGLDTLIVDHHKLGAELPAAFAIVNPNRHDDTSGLGHLCAAGLTFILAAATARVLREAGWWSPDRPELDLLGLLDHVALGTVCDVVPLTGLNRAYVAQGLKVMAGRAHQGLAALADVARLKRRPDVHALGYLLGPRLNAAGRLGRAEEGLRLLLSEDRGEAMQLAERLDRLNRERQDIELAIVEEALTDAEGQLARAGGDLPVMVVAGEGWHPGVLGLVASRLKERTGLPSLALAWPKGGEVAQGSGRSIAGVDLGRAVQQALAEGIIVKGGGHAMAAGLTVGRGRIEVLREVLARHLAEESRASRAMSGLEIEGALTASAATVDFIRKVEEVGPFGSGNPAPVFAFPAHRIAYAAVAGADHVRCALAAGDGTRLKAIAFRAMGTGIGEYLLAERGQPVHVAGRLALDDWGGRLNAQLMIEDVAEIGRP